MSSTKVKEIVDEKTEIFCNNYQSVSYTKTHTPSTFLVSYLTKLFFYTAIELDKEANAEAICAEFGSGIWIRGGFIPSFNELSTLDKKGDLDDLLKNAPKTTYTTPR